MSEGDISVKVSIGDRIYPLKIKMREEEFVRKAAKMINEKMKFYNNNFSVKDDVDGLAMAALEFAVEALGKAAVTAEPALMQEHALKHLSDIEASLGL
ncbi:MAG: cell division protein ZapA [Bacteroidia bacterium]|nr:cell division protein ZapA [Bacteroidia bacterium]